MRDVYVMRIQSSTDQSSDCEESSRPSEEPTKCPLLVRDESMTRRVNLFLNLLDDESSVSWGQLQDDFV